MPEQVVGRRHFHHFAEVQHDDPVGDVANHRKIVGNEEVREAEPFLQLEHQVDDLRLDVDVESRDRLSGHNDIRTDRQGTSDGDALPLAAGEFIGLARHRLAGQADEVEQFGHPRAGRCRIPGDAVQDQRTGEDLANRHARIE